MINIILCGGSGTRLWPLSRKSMPKQFLKLFDNQSLFQLTVKRNNHFCDKNFIITGDDLYFLAQDELDTINQKNNTFLLEGIGRNTAPAITLAAMMLGIDEIMFITPSDHLIKDEKAYQKSVKIAKKLAQENNLVTFGITPDYAETGYGYLKANGYNVDGFYEKPDKITAEKYLADGNYYWNSGMFCFKAGVLLEEIKEHSPEIYQASGQALKNIKDNLRISKQDMLNIPEDSIDYAVMEKSNIVKVVPLDASWSDVGSFEALSQEMPNDVDNNLILSDKLVKTIGIKDSVIVDSGDAILVAKKDNSQQVKDIVNQLKQDRPEILHCGLTGYRPWGSYTILDENQGYKVKRIVVKPHKKLSLQSHKFRNEHWVVISGEAEVVNNDKTFVLKENESTYIQAGHKHRLINNTNKDLVIIEAQVGSYTGEDDIQRFDDDFNRE